jgi:predicted AlkP superfamily pyrophosphatase or phosphodiesterase
LNEAVSLVDAQIGGLIAGLKARGLADKATIIVVADHGMAAVSPDRTLYMDTIIPKETYHWFTKGSVMGLEATPGHEAEIETALVGAHDHFACYKKGQFPEKWHYGTHRRIPEITCVAETGWLIGADPTKGTGYKAGAHGFDPYHKDMAAIFIANGPMIAKHYRLEPFDNVDVYDLMMHLLGLKAEPNDGTLATFDKVELKGLDDN